MSRRRLFGRRGGGGLALLILILLIVALVNGSPDNARRDERPGGERGGRGDRGQPPAPGPDRRPGHRRADGRQRPDRAGTTALVTRVVDGDTVLASIGGNEEYVRYIGVDTPESVKPGTPVQCYAKRASHFNAGLVEGRRVRLVFDRERRDAYGRLLAYVYAGPRFVNATLVRRGLARTLTISPNDSHARLFERLQTAAGRAGRGLWGSC